MRRFTFYVEGCEIEIEVPAASEREAREQVWTLLSDEQRDATVGLECVDEVAA